MSEIIINSFLIALIVFFCLITIIDILYSKKINSKLTHIKSRLSFFNRQMFLLNFLLGLVFEFFSYRLPSNKLRVFFTRLRGIKVGKNVYLGREIIFDRVFPSLIQIGDNSSIGDRCIISAHAHATVPRDLHNWKIFEKVERVVIGTNVWIMPRVTIIPGIEIGDNTVITTGSIIDKNIEPGSIVTFPKSQIKKLPKSFN